MKKTKKINFCIVCNTIVIGRVKKCDECKRKAKEHPCKICGKPITGKARKCQVCKDREAEQKRIKTCECGTVFILTPDQKGLVRTCPLCREGDYKFAHRRVSDFIDNPDEYYPHIPIEGRIRKFASKSRNDVQSTSDYSSFKMSGFKFQSNNQGKPTMDHVNAMTYIIEYYIKQCFAGNFINTLENFKKYYDRYAVQFPVSREHNEKLRVYQAKGVTPEQYISVVGPLVGKTAEESIEIIRPHFIHG
jgi:hypothetical protein